MRARNERRRRHIFCVLFHDRVWGPLVGSVTVSASAQGRWRTEWDVGTIDRDPPLSDRWFCREEYEQQFEELLNSAAAQADSPAFEIPGATLRWGFAKGMRKELALELASNVFGLWQRILIDWDGVQTEPSI